MRNEKPLDQEFATAAANIRRAVVAFESLVPKLGARFPEVNAIAQQVALKLAEGLGAAERLDRIATELEGPQITPVSQHVAHRFKTDPRLAHFPIAAIVEYGWKVLVLHRGDQSLSSAIEAAYREVTRNCATVNHRVVAQVLQGDLRLPDSAVATS